MRRRFTILAATLLSAMAAAAAKTPDTIFVNGGVYTMDATGRATALAVTGERISYVGNDAAARQLAGPETKVIDLRGRMLLPGFQDSHVHPGLAPNPATRLDVGGLGSREAIVRHIGEYARQHPTKPWIVGTGWEESAFLPSGQPTRAMLDAVTGDRPAFLTNNSQHMGWVNSAALKAAGITKASPDPANGRVERDAAGEPTGVLQEAAMDLVRKVIPQPAVAEQAEDLVAAMREMNRLGITAYEDALVRPDLVPAYLALGRRQALGMRINLCLYFDPAVDDDEQIRRFIAQRAEFAGTAVRARCVKIVLDGAYGSHTVALLEPYSDEPEKFGTGRLFVAPDRLKKVVTRLDAEGFQVHVHAIGDGAVRNALDAFAEARRANGPRDARHTIAHLGLIDAADLPRFRQLGVIANMSPLWSRGDPWETVFAPKLFGPARSGRLYPTRSLLDAGAVLVWGSDWPVTDVAPLAGLETAVTHRYPGGRDPEGATDKAWIPAERISLAQALIAYTSAGAYLVKDEANRGSLASGKLADLVVLSRNLFKTDPLAIHEATVDLTMVGGRVVFERN
jgi:predicted amidohydrolase YtcJ